MTQYSVCITPNILPPEVARRSWSANKHESDHLYNCTLMRGRHSACGTGTVLAIESKDRRSYNVSLPRLKREPAAIALHHGFRNPALALLRPSCPGFIVQFLLPEQTIKSNPTSTSAHSRVPPPTFDLVSDTGSQMARLIQSRWLAMSLTLAAMALVVSNC